MIYRATLQPDLTSSPYTLNPAVYGANGQGLTLINNSGNGSNDLQTITTTGFSIHTQTFSQLFFSGNGGFLVSGYNNNSLTAEIRMAPTMANILSNDITQYIFILLGPPSVPNANFVNAVWYSDTYQPSIAIFGGSFVCSAGQFCSNGPINVFPSAVSNILVISTDPTGGQIFPYDMAGAGGFYGFNNQVRCFAQLPMSGIMVQGSPNSNLYVAVGGQFLDTTPPQGGGNDLAGVALIKIDTVGNQQFSIQQIYGLVFFNLPFDYVSFLGVSAVPASQTLQSYLVMGGNYSAGGNNWTGLYLAASSWEYWDATQGGWANTFFFNETPYDTVGSYITAGFPANPSANTNTEWILSIFNTSTQLFDTIKKEITYNGVSWNTSIAVIETGHPSGVFSYAMDIGQTYPLSLKYAIGGSNKFGQTPFCFEFANTAYLNLGGTLNFGNNAYQASTAVWWFFRDPETAGNINNDNYTEEIPNSIIPVVINTTSALPFVNYLTPTIFNDTITLATTNNFALGTYVGHGTNDRRILIHTHNGATFS